MASLFTACPQDSRCHTAQGASTGADSGASGDTAPGDMLAVARDASVLIGAAQVGDL